MEKVPCLKTRKKKDREKSVNGDFWRGYSDQNQGRKPMSKHLNI